MMGEAGSQLVACCASSGSHGHEQNRGRLGEPRGRAGGGQATQTC